MNIWFHIHVFIVSHKCIETTDHKDVIEQKMKLESQVADLEAEITELKKRPAVIQAPHDTSDTKPTTSTEDTKVAVVPVIVSSTEDDKLISKQDTTTTSQGQPEVKEVIKEVVKEVYIGELLSIYLSLVIHRFKYHCTYNNNALDSCSNMKRNSYN